MKSSEVLVMNAKTIMPDIDLYKSWHLTGSEHDLITTEFEWILIRFNEAFQRYCTEVANAVGLDSINYQSILILNIVGLKNKAVTVAEITNLLNQRKNSEINISIRYLYDNKLIIRERKNGNDYYSVSKYGKKCLSKYNELRKVLLTNQTKTINFVDEKLFTSSKLIGILTGMYDVAGQLALVSKFKD